MADNTQVNNGTGDVIRDIDRVGVKTQVMALDAGGKAAESLVSPTNPLPTQDANLAAATSADQPLYTALVGDPNGDFAGLNLLEQVMDENSGFKINVREANPYNVDDQRSLILSDHKVFRFTLNGAINQPIVDCAGYQSVLVDAMRGGGGTTASMQWSSDGVVWSTTLAGAALSGNVVLSGGISLGSSGVTSLPVYARYMRILPQAGSTGSITVILKQGPSSLSHSNIISVGGSLISNITGNSSVLGVGGPTAQGGAIGVNNPVLVAGADAANLARRLLTDTLGRIQTLLNGVDIGATARSVGVVYPSEGQASLMVQDTTQEEDFSQIEVLLMMLKEQKLTNQYLFQLLTDGQASASDNPEALRNEPSFIN